MRNSLIFYLLSFSVLFSIFLYSQEQTTYKYEASLENPYGLPNPDASKEIKDFAPLIGICSCQSISRINQDTWGDTTLMTWTFKYIMNGMGIQDETLKEDGIHAGSIRQFIPDSARWYVHYYSSGSPSTALPVWEGNKTKTGEIILYRDQIAPNGMEGKYRITFFDVDKRGFNWIGEWVDLEETYSYPTWKIFCQKTMRN